MKPIFSRSAISTNAWDISSAWSRDSSAQGPAISVSGRSLPRVTSPTWTWRTSLARSESGISRFLRPCHPKRHRGDRAFEHVYVVNTVADER